MPDVLRQAGFRGRAYDLANAIRMAESHGNALAHNTNAATGDNSYGEFQINMLGALGPERLKQYHLQSNNDLFNPLTNARVAYQLSKGGTDWSPWSTYKNGAYKSFLGKGGQITQAETLQRQQAGLSPATNLGGDPTSARNNALMQYALAQSTALLSGDTGGSTPALLGMLQSLPSETTTTSSAKGSYSPNLPVGSTLSKNISGKLKLSNVPTEYDTRAGIQVNAAIMPSVLNIARNFGVKVNSGYRSAAHNEAVGGATHSDHLSGNAVDFTGSPDAMHRLYNWAQGRFPYVEPWDQAGGNHVHISFIR